MPESDGEKTYLVRHTTQETVVDHLRSLILSRTLKPGARLVQSTLAEQLGVSRTPIREALHKLDSEGLVTISAYKGAAVADFSLEELQEIYCVRIALEGYAAYLAAQEVTESDLEKLEAFVRQMESLYAKSERLKLLEVNREFYRTLYAIPEQTRLHKMIMKHMDLANVYRRMAFTLDRVYGTTVPDHQELLEKLRQGDAEAVETLTRVGLEKTADALIQMLQKSKNEHNQQDS
ncbi:MAG TPA: GntR family transcriptional regulator [Candidatus Sulfomarinibacteraceae bacterium]|nr:GntR family transcriptional regulator [Candidatus Sulfomarinibacteraceae bacterium]